MISRTPRFIPAAILLLPAVFAYAGESTTYSDRDNSNIGFMKNPPEELTTRFPMCNAFLNVTWIDKAKRIGYTHYEARLLNDRHVLGKKSKSVWALVTLDDDHPSYTLDIYGYQQQHRMQELHELVSNGEVTRVPSHFAINYKGHTTVFYDPISPVLGYHRQTICIAYPDGMKAWIIEGKSVSQMLDAQQAKALLRRTKAAGVDLSKEQLGELWMLDLNFDGQDDYIFDHLNQVLGLVEYSLNGKAYIANQRVEDSAYLLSFPPSDTSCRLDMDSVFPLITDGKNFYISNQCNITKLISSHQQAN